MNNQQISKGWGAIESLENILLKYHAKNILLVTGKNSYKGANVSPYIERLKKKFVITIFDDHPHIPYLDQIFLRLQKISPKADCIVALGGGKILDIAKIINTILSSEIPATLENFETLLPKNVLPLIAIPTTSGSGSEATRFAVYYQGSQKYSLDSPILLPPEVILDPQVTMGVPEIEAAGSGLDALCQALESVWCVHSTEESRRIALEAAKELYSHLKASVVHLDKTSREVVHYAAFKAGQSINITKTTLAHALSYYFTIHYGVPHGHAVALNFGPNLLFNSSICQEDCSDLRGLEFVHYQMEKIYQVFHAKDAKESCENFIELIEQVNLKSSVFSFMPRESLPELISTINMERAKNNPRRFDPKNPVELAKCFS